MRITAGFCLLAIALAGSSANASEENLTLPPGITTVEPYVANPSTPPVASAEKRSRITVSFDPASVKLSKDALSVLDKLADDLSGKLNSRLKISAYAAPVGATPVEARRLSLKRALSIREHLIGRGIAAMRINVRALGTPSDAQAPDRADIVILSP